MKDKNSPEEIQKYAKDIQIIKDILIKVDENPIVETWVFYLCGIMFIIATLTHYVLSTMFSFQLVTLIFAIWVPLFCILMFAESFGVVRKLASESIPLFSRTILKLYLGGIGILIASVFIIVIISKHCPMNILPGSIMALWGIFYFQYAQIGYSFLFAHGYLSILTGIILYFSGIDASAQFIIIGIFIGISMIIAGYSAGRKEKIKNG